MLILSNSSECLIVYSERIKCIIVW